ncbi:MAG TPA: L-serine ammonia-lyase, iron-sulfur-dependent, subunit alpha [Sphaerochaeta sp.]|nr:L-serine ammonia-lyase, iron-sulfur-dependent, subunit alpha [Sphaerochaeta sp.]HPY44392.1 L-serine ammonia-lyase, iron-sulfur-dependent, subunit alpha [Sphaerochaeta sp.]HQB05454.1 L-serine ammonia-lyase, iron-sulfur-dependent, subunit alpha [Sphaerochaeta sp.]
MDRYLSVLQREMRVAMGCTEPAAAALCAARASELLGENPVRLHVSTSGEMLKNAMGVGIPNTALKGLKAAVALGAAIADIQAGLNILSTIDEAVISKAEGFPVSLTIVKDVPSLYIQVEAVGLNHFARATISGEHERFSELVKDEEVLLSLPLDGCSATLEEVDEVILSKSTLADILSWIEEAPPEAHALVLNALETNLSIARHSLESEYGLTVGKTIFTDCEKELQSLDQAFKRGSALAAAASDARMAGCPLPVVINSGSGNQGITLTVPLAPVAEHLRSSDEELARALLVGQLVGLSLTAHKSRLSALCGAFTAAIGTACSLVYLLGGSQKQMDMAFNTMVGNLTGIICDGAKGTCALKIYSCVEAAHLAVKLALKGVGADGKSGIVGMSSQESIDFLARLMKEGMGKTEETILSIMVGKEE